MLLKNLLHTSEVRKICIECSQLTVSLFKLLWRLDELFLPSFKNCSLDFIRKLFSGDKSVCIWTYCWYRPSKPTMFQSFNVPKYSEIIVKVLWNFVKDCEDLCNYFPDYEADQLRERRFILGILSTLRSDELRQLIKDARKNRSIQENPDEDQLIDMDADKKEAIMSLFPQKVCFHSYHIQNTDYSRKSLSFVEAGSKT